MSCVQLNKAGGHIGRNVVEITIKMKIIVRKTLNDKNQQASSQKFRQLLTFFSFKNSFYFNISFEQICLCLRGFIYTHITAKKC